MSKPTCDCESRKVPNKRGVWYLEYCYECPVCGRYEDTKVRHDCPKPDDWTDRVVWGYLMCYCYY